MIPSSVSTIGDSAFQYCSRLTSVNIPNSITSIENRTFGGCSSLDSVTIPNGVTNIGDFAFSGSGVTSVTIPNKVATLGYWAFFDCTSLTNVTIPASVTTISGKETFEHCTSLEAITVDGLNPVYSSMDGVLFNKTKTTPIQCPGGKAGSNTIPNSVTTIGIAAFYNCTNLTGAYFQGNTPTIGSDVFVGADNATVYYLPETTGWGPTFGDRPTVLWNPQALTSDGSFGVQGNQFGFTIAGRADIPLVVEASTNLSSPVWVTLQSCTLTNGSFYFSDPQWTNHARRFYRLRSP